MSALTLPTFLRKSWNRWKNAVAFVPLREALGRDLDGAIMHERNAFTRQELVRLWSAFTAAGGRSGDGLCDKLPFPRRAPPSRQPAQKTITLPLRSAIEAEFLPDPAEADAAD